MTTPTALSARDIDPLVLGVSLLGSGGGGDAATFSRVLRHLLGTGTIPLHPPDELAGHTVVPVGVVGATSVFLEKLPSGQELTRAIQAVTRWSGIQATAIMSFEAGGLNGITGLVSSLQLNLPFLDADLMGRAMPRLDQFSWSAAGLPLVPCAVSEPGGQVMILDHASPEAVERSVRALLSQCGGWAALALRPAPVREILPSVITGSLARAVELGWRHADLTEPPTRENVEAALAGQVLGVGRVRSIDRQTSDRVGTSSIHVEDSDTGAVLRIEAENEYLLALVDGRVMASAPDLLCLLDRRNALPREVDHLRPGDEVIVVTLAGPEWWKSRPDYQSIVGPAAFGLNSQALTEGGIR